MACDPYDSVRGEKFPDGLVLRKNFSIMNILRSIVSLENVGVLGSSVKLPP
jgi:hypothetical protein